jgi:hypothetical protein
MKMTGDNSSSWCCVIGGAKDAVQSTPRHWQATLHSFLSQPHR